MNASTANFSDLRLRKLDGFRVEIDPARERADIVLDRPPLNVIEMDERDQHDQHCTDIEEKFEAGCRAAYNRVHGAGGHRCKLVDLADAAARNFRNHNETNQDSRRGTQHRRHNQVTGRIRDGGA